VTGVAQVRPLQRDERGTAARVLADALLDDPAWVSVVPDRQARRRALSALTGVALRTSAGASRAAVGADGDVLGVAVWQAPGDYPPGRLRTLRTAAPALPSMLRLGRQARDLQRFGAALDACYPTTPVRYLQALGVAPHAQGRGVGRALLAEGLAVARAEQVPVYLETGKRENVAYYEGNGFVLLEPGRALHPDGPVMWRLQWTPDGAPRPDRRPPAPGR
jgi:GNAT superfamily N-acetyltransferase